MNLDAKLGKIEHEDRKKVTIYDITGVTSNENGFQSSDGTINPSNPKQSEVESVKIKLTLNTVESVEITLTGTNLQKFFDQTLGYDLVCNTLFGYDEFTAGAYMFTMTYSGSTIGGAPVEWEDVSIIYLVFSEEFRTAVRQSAVEINIPLSYDPDTLSAVINSSVIEFLIRDAEYSCELGMGDRAQEIIDGITELINSGEMFIDNIVA